MPLEVFAVVAPSPVDGACATGGAAVVAASSCLIVEVEVDLLLKPLVRGARWVSFSSTNCQLPTLHSRRYILTLCEFPRHDVGVCMCLNPFQCSALVVRPNLQTLL